MARRRPYSGVPSLARPQEEPQVPIPDAIDEEPAHDMEARAPSPPPKKRRVMKDSATPKASTTGKRRQREAPVMRGGIAFYLCSCGTCDALVYRFPSESLSHAVCFLMLPSCVSLCYRQGVQGPFRSEALHGQTCRNRT